MLSGIGLFCFVISLLIYFGVMEFRINKLERKVKELEDFILQALKR